MSAFPKYGRVFQLGVQSSLEYRFDFLFSLISAIFPILIQYYIWSAVYGRSESSEFFGYTYGQMILYTITAAIVTKIVTTDIGQNVATEIKDGGLNKYLVQPVSFFALKLFTMLGQKIFFFSAMLCILLFTLVYLTGTYGIRIPLAHILLFMVSMVMSLLLNFLISYTLAAVAFILSEISYFFEMTGLFVIILSGGVFPIEVFGKTINKILDYLPFKYTIHFPANVINGRLSMDEAVQGIGMQFFWMIALLAFSRIVWRAGMKKYLGLGG
ncbi:ABC-2 family transporter protein [Paenibacillus polymyxa]|uniref:ABC transporter permease n=1 Tax=Paenibacillus polymyxa TaxID=1406 RepID=UPI002AB35CF0|nr:ABC-2 family transporter protein [Paenibacillus polymyxa]MDY7991046.1 ABC-2 family transporter protein [Paenibacillus polymyxa]MDY8119836.1 ABC-2 family transporter protein [Paenibacillus polymyxa]